MIGKRIGSRRTAVAASMAAFALVGPTAAFADGQKSQSQSHQSKGSPVVTTTSAAPGSSQSAQGVVQSVGSATVVVKQLDGRTITVPVDRKTTQVFVNNKHAEWTDVRPGYVLTASWKAGKPAPTLRFTRS
jgi:hypothetical protein